MNWALGACCLYLPVSQRTSPVPEAPLVTRDLYFLE